MKALKYFPMMLIALFVSCSDDDGSSIQPETLTEITHFQNDTHVIELYSKSGILQNGYNDIYLKIKDISSGTYIPNAAISWNPMMQMMSMSHSCPQETPIYYSSIGFYKGFIIFQMPGNSSEHWTLNIDYVIDGTSYSVSHQIDVLPTTHQRVTTFTGSDGIKYIAALVEPSDPKVGINEMTAAIYTMQSMTSFEKVEGYTLAIDPRMPSMGNHGSPNNTDLVESADGFYHGQLSLTMTGYWKINLRLIDDSGESVKGEAVNEFNSASSIYFEIEF